MSRESTNAARSLALLSALALIGLVADAGAATDAGRHKNAGPNAAAPTAQDTTAAAQDTAAAETTAEAAAVAAARDWLKLVDAKDYDASWEQGASMFRQAITKEGWSKAVTQARGPLDPFSDRTLVSAQHTTNLPGAPPGEYVVIRFRTAVKGGGHVIETVVPMLDDGAWRVSGYFVRAES
jgi:pyruvate/2-oxoglutarate dehydrogenase complex dihydrolipoamide acyltransferase (E2) component